jgi:hypothetical protein
VSKRWWVLIVAGLALGAAGCGAPSRSATPTRPIDAHATGREQSVQWILTSRALRQLGADPTVRARIESGRVFEIVTPGQPVVGGPDIVRTVSFPSYAELSAAVDGGNLPAGTTAVLYDAEAWSLTPPDEQADPTSYYARAGELAAAHHLMLIAAPALNLATGAGPSSSAARARAYLERGLPAAAARHAAVYEIQAQSLERNAEAYAAFVRAAASAARAANPGVTVLAGLSTNPPGAPVDAAQLVAAIRATLGVVDGYWVNIPGQGPKCPTCNPENPAVGIDALGQVLSAS